MKAVQWFYDKSFCKPNAQHIFDASKSELLYMSTVLPVFGSRNTVNIVVNQTELEKNPEYDSTYNIEV